MHTPSRHESSLSLEEEPAKSVPCEWLFPSRESIYDNHHSLLQQQIEEVGSRYFPSIIVHLIIEFEYGSEKKNRVNQLYQSHCQREASDVFMDYFQRRYYMHYCFRNIAGFGLISSLFWFISTETRLPKWKMITNEDQKNVSHLSVASFLPASRYLMGYVAIAGAFELFRNASFARSKSEFIDFDKHFFHKSRLNHDSDENDTTTATVILSEANMELRRKWNHLCFRYPHTHKPMLNVRENGDGWRLYAPYEDYKGSDSTVTPLYECNLSLLYASILELAPRNPDIRMVVPHKIAQFISDFPTIVPIYTMFSSISQIVSAMLSATVYGGGMNRMGMNNNNNNNNNNNVSRILNRDAHRVSLKWCFTVVVTSMQMATMHRNYFPKKMRKMAAILSGLWAVICGGLAFIDARESSERQSMNIDWLGMSSVTAERKRMYPYRLTHALPWILSSATFTFSTIRDWFDDDGKDHSQYWDNSLYSKFRLTLPRLFHGCLFVSTLLNIGNYTYLDTGYAYENLNNVNGNQPLQRSDIEIMAKRSNNELNQPRDVFEYCSYFSCQMENIIMNGTVLFQKSVQNQHHARAFVVSS